MKIIVASTPKTGNTWMTHLLSAVYDLREVELPETFSPAVTNQMGDGWISLQHYYPDPVILAWARRHGATIVTTARHPGDLLVSLRYMVLNKSYDPRVDLRRVAWLGADGAKMGERSAQYVRDAFYYGLYISLVWIKSSESFGVRYEDLWRDPVTTLTELTNQIKPVPKHRIEGAVDANDLKMLRKLYRDPKSKFFRKGGPGGWRKELPEEILDIFRHQEPYPSIFKALGYTLDPHDPLIDAPAKPRASTNPFIQASKFDNGVPIPSLAIKHFLLSDPELKSQWAGNETSTAVGSFFAWLNAPASQDPRGGEQGPLVSNIAYHVYRARPDLQDLLPDLFGQDRKTFAVWFVRNGYKEHEIDRAFVTPMQEALEAAGIDTADEPDPWQRQASMTTGSLQTTAGSHQQVGSAASDAALPAALERVHATATVNSHWPIAWPNWPKGLWPKAEALAKKAIRRLLGWYINPIVGQQNAFNTAVVEALAELRAETYSLQEETPGETDAA